MDYLPKKLILEILEYNDSKVEEIYLSCPDCQDVFDDSQYCCVVCGCEGGYGNFRLIDIIESLKKDHER
jgi:hypothetical protein